MREELLEPNPLPARVAVPVQKPMQAPGAGKGLKAARARAETSSDVDLFLRVTEWSSGAALPA